MPKNDYIPFLFCVILFEMVFCYQNCSDLLWEKKWSSDGEKNLKLEAEGREFAKFLRSLEQFIQTIRTMFGNRMLFFNFFPKGFSCLIN